MTKVLIVEDDPKMRRLYDRAFSFAGYNTAVAKNGVLGLKSVNKLSPDLVLLDIMMPKMNGLQVLENLKGNPSTSEIPVIMLTNIASGTLESAEEAVKKGALDYIIKSDHEPNEVVEIAQNVLQSVNG